MRARSGRSKEELSAVSCQLSALSLQRCHPANLVILSEGTPENPAAFQKTQRKFRLGSRSFTAGRFERVGEGVTPAMHYRQSSERRAFC